ncbi:hydantoinase B/oxoprolinase family protein [Aureimonas populi]|uniref:Hydantoinase B/oxoprolinase family protein n=1 Tax=Aureimonas populi TaxID=1701758 RepID=A0ABW5CTD1_9HYPH|nr:hydantoinase B/oxoprolinase family protein [Aureimonas populi]
MSIARSAAAPGASPPRACDPVALEIIRGAIGAAQSEMEALIERTAISAFIREKKDFYTALFDADGVMAVGSLVPIFGDITRPVFDVFPRETMNPGDVYWYNDCYASRGAVSHLNDQVLLAPIFHEGAIRGFVMSWAHFADIGGLHPGSISPQTTDIHQEGIIIPPTRLIDKGVTNEAALAIFHRNSRFPEQSIGDMSALLASVRLGAQRMLEIIERFSARVVEDALAQLLQRTRGHVREKLAQTFDYGTYRFTDAIDSDGHGSGPIRMRISLTREKGEDGQDRFIFDTRDSDDQATGPVNLLLNPAVPGMALGIYFLGGDRGQVINAGGPQSLDGVLLREGSILQPREPAPLGMRGLTMMRLLAAINGLINVGGGSAPAAHSAYVVAMLRGSFTNEAGESERFLLVDGLGVGYGGRDHADGIDAVYFVAQENYPVEFLELSYPVRLRSYGIARDSGGAGRHRGGTGIVREYEILADRANLSIRIDGVRNPPWGVRGGMSGGSGSAIVNPGAPDERTLDPLSDGNVLGKGDVLRIVTGGGGGFGHPFDRSVEAVLEDVLGGFVSPERAERDYGVVVSRGEVDEAATAARRADRPATKGFHRMEYVDAIR